MDQDAVKRGEWGWGYGGDGGMAMWQSEGWTKGDIVSVEEAREISVLWWVSFHARCCSSGLFQSGLGFLHAEDDAAKHHIRITVLWT